jgi:hypothetical protein
MKFRLKKIKKATRKLFLKYGIKKTNKIEEE